MILLIWEEQPVFHIRINVKQNPNPQNHSNYKRTHKLIIRNVDAYLRNKRIKKSFNFLVIEEKIRINNSFLKKSVHFCKDKLDSTKKFNVKFAKKLLFLKNLLI